MGYLVYLVTAVPVTIWVARTLSRNGAVFLRDVYEENEGLADAVNQLLVVGFYLLNLGFVLLFLRTGGQQDGAADMITAVSVKIGSVLLVLGIVHLVNLGVFTSMRRNHRAPTYQSTAVSPATYAAYPQR
ncbi:hypothetical protein ASD11_16670 [Aeromicrobium sp. Root495]|nr:hypothetical protein ASD11_16670 [Aeromicrobium sp. Root495]